MNEQHVLAAWVHGWLSGLHLLGTVYNARRRNWVDVVAHSAALAYSVRAVIHHAKEAGPSINMAED